MGKFTNVECSFLNRKNPNGLIITDDELTLPSDIVGLFLDGYETDLSKMQGTCDNFRISGDVIYCDVLPIGSFLELMEAGIKPSIRLSMIGTIKGDYLKDVTVVRCFTVCSDTDTYTKPINPSDLVGET